MSKDKSLEQEIEDFVHSLTVGKYMRDPEGNFVPLDESIIRQEYESELKDLFNTHCQKRELERVIAEHQDMIDRSWVSDSFRVEFHKACIEAARDQLNQPIKERIEE